jgi:hypothetical protein
MKPEPINQCPTCHFQRVDPTCGAGKRRINENESGELFKAIDCVLYQERHEEVSDTGEKICPTCGQVIIEPLPIPESEATQKTLTTLCEELGWSSGVAEDALTSADPVIDQMSASEAQDQFVPIDEAAPISTEAWENLTPYDISVKPAPQELFSTNLESPIFIDSISVNEIVEVPKQPPAPKRRTQDIPRARYRKDRKRFVQQ